MYMMMMSSVQPFSALGDPMNKGSPLMSTLHQLSQFFPSVSCFCKDALHPSHPLSASPLSTTNLPEHYILLHSIPPHHVSKVRHFQFQYPCIKT